VSVKKVPKKEVVREVLKSSSGSVAWPPYRWPARCLRRTLSQIDTRSTVGLAAAQLTLQATALGIAVHQMGGFSMERARELFGIPKDFEPVAAIAIGYTDLSNAERVRPRGRQPGLAAFTSCQPRAIYTARA
jgi:nitroreductase